MQRSSGSCVCGVLVCVLLVMMGCTRYHYDLKMAVEENGQMRRTLTVVGTADQPNAISPRQLTSEDAQPLEQIYGVPPEILNGADRRFAATFQDSLPQDIGGAGRVFRWETSLGSVVTYRERFRGSYDFQSMIEERQQAISRLCELFAEWAKQEANVPVVGDEIQRFVNTTVKSDLLNATMMILLLETEKVSGFEHLFTPPGPARLHQFLIERGYLTDDMIPLFDRVQSVPDEQLSLAIRMLDLKRSETNAKPLRDLLPALKNAEALQASLNKFLVNTPEYQQREEKPEPTQVLMDLFMTTLGHPLRGGDVLGIRISAVVPPAETNGDWDEQAQQITWEARLEIPGEPVSRLLPTFCYARWANPNEGFQKSHFGRLIFKDKSLLGYVNWRMALTESEGEEWDRFLDTVTPATPITGQVFRFVFHTSESTPMTQASQLQRVRNLFQQAEESMIE